MKLKTIINTKSYLLAYSLIISVFAHLCAWFLIPNYNRSLLLNEIITAKVVNVQNTFTEIKISSNTEIKIGSKPTAQSTQKKESVQVKVQKKAIKKTRRKRISKRRKWKKRSRPKPVPKPKAKTVVKPPAKPPAEPDTVAKASETKVQPDSTPESAVDVMSESSSEAVNETEQGSKDGSETQVAQIISKKDLRGILRGYYKNLNSLMSARRDYPRSARRLGLEGTVLVEMVINQKGHILSVKLIQSSGHEVLDRAAIAQVHKIGRVPSIPNQIKRTSMTFRIPFEYRLQS